MTEAKVIPQCLQCSSYVGTLKGKSFICKSCGCATDQPEEIWKKPEAEEVTPLVSGDSILHTDGLRVLLEAYDRGTHPFNNESDARDLQPHISNVFEEVVEEAKGAATEEAEAKAGKHLAERRQALIETVTDACAPHLQGLGADIVALIEEYIPDV